jgi:hypothetical protein
VKDQRLIADPLSRFSLSIRMLEITQYSGIDVLILISICLFNSADRCPETAEIEPLPFKRH